jgi:hypothetical protein
MMRRFVPIVGTLVTLSTLAGCKATPDTDRVETRSKRVPVQREAVTADDYVMNVVTAPTAAAEADAIRKLRQWEIDNGMTYTVKARRSSDYSEVEDPSTVREPLRAEVTIYRGRDPVRSFVFQPRDNRNLALFGE